MIFAVGIGIAIGIAIGNRQFSFEAQSNADAR